MLDRLELDTGAWDPTSGRAALSEDIAHFYESIGEARHTGQYPGVTPSLRYWTHTSRCGYLTDLCPVAGMRDLAHLITFLVSSCRRRRHRRRRRRRRRVRLPSLTD